MVLFGHDHTRCNETILNVEGKPVVEEVVSPASSKISSAEVVPVVHKVPVSVALADSAEQVLVSVPVQNMVQADVTVAAVVIAPERIRAR